MNYKELLVKLRDFDTDCDNATNEKPKKLVGYEKTIKEIKGSFRVSRSILVCGPNGVGKTLIVNELAQKELSKKYFYLRASWMISKLFGDPETQLKKLFKEVKAEAPSIIFIDKIDFICSKKRCESRDKIFSVLEFLLEQLRDYNERNPNKEVIFVAATDKPESLDPEISKYFSGQINFPLPTRQDRVKMLKELIPKISCDHLEKLADATHCYLYGDLIDLKKVSQSKSVSVLEATGIFTPKTLANYTTPYLPLKWDDIGGMEHAKKALHKSVIRPIKEREKFMNLCASMTRGALLYGPPGCSKTMLARALATESGFSFISIKGPELFSKYVGDSEAAVRRLYRNAREIAPCIIFFDEIDGFACQRSDDQGSSVNVKVVTQLLTEFNGPSDDVFTIAATNRPDRVDSALLRPGRLGSTIYIPLPSEAERVQIFKVHMRKRPLKFDKPFDDVVSGLASQTPLYSGADIEKICHEAGEYCFDEDLEMIEERHFAMALQTVNPKTNPESLKIYEEFDKKRQSETGDNPNDSLTELNESFRRILSSY